MGRPKLSAEDRRVRIDITIRPRMVRALDWLAARAHVGRGELVERLLSNALHASGTNVADERFDPPKEKSK